MIGVNDRNLKVSVCVITYNQEKYIRRCLQSIIDQVIDFDFEVIVGEDCSTDNTRLIVQEFAKKYPKLINLVLHDKNVGGCENYRSVHRMASGKYIAHVDGDDWIYPGKLLKQVQYLDSNQHCALVAHRMSIWVGGRQVGSTKRLPSLISLTELLLGHPIFLGSSIMYRREKCFNIFPSHVDFIDFYIYIQAALKADIGFVNEELGGYTSNVGVSCAINLMPYIQAALDLADGVVSRDVINSARAKQYLSYAIAALMAGDNERFVESMNAARQFGQSSFVIYGLFCLRKYDGFIRMFVYWYKSLRVHSFRLKKLFFSNSNV
jgi:glycosyltransferase involved in cell wall biosynthesis